MENGLCNYKGESSGDFFSIGRGLNLSKGLGMNAMSSLSVRVGLN